MGRSKKAKEAAKKALRTTSLGTWFYDKHGKKKYISLNGKVAHGAEATRLSQKDMYHEQHPAQLMRMELCQRMKNEASSATLLQLNSEDRLLSLHCWGLPTDVLTRYNHLGITKLFQWQVDCLLMENGQVLDGSKNMIYSAPTSGGKTLVAELLMIRKLAQTMVHGNPKRHPRRTIFFIVPFIALAEEKVNYLQHLWQDMNIGVRAYHQDDGSSNDLGTDVEVVVCTIERANILLTKLLQEKRGNQLSMVVIDEIHMLSDPSRGFLLEVLLSKIRFSLYETVQIIGMSATLPNIELLADWLDAALYRTDYRPIALQLLVAREGGLYSIHHDISGKQTIHIKQGDLIMCKEDPDGLVALAVDSMRNHRNMIIFCPSKIRCEQTAGQLAYLLQQQGVTQDEYGSAEIHLKRAQLLRRLDTGLTAHGLCPKLQQTIPYGIAYHHAGLVKEERKLLEEAYREGIITVLTATSTLAAGVNLPAHRVIILSLSMGDAKLSVSTFRQMCGRAGRLGFQTSLPSIANGEAIIMLGMKPSVDKLRQLEELITLPVEALQSNLDRAAGGGLEKLLLEMIACECIIRSNQILTFLRSTLYGTHHSLQESMAKVQTALEYLQQQQFVILLQDGGTMQATAFGRATIASGIAPKDAVEVLRILNAARRSFVMTSGLHALFLVIPPDTMIRTDWKGFDKLLDILYQEHPEAEQVAREIGIEKARLVDFSLGRKFVKAGSSEYQLYNRFFSAIVLFPFMHEWPLPKTMKKIVTAVDNGYPGVSRGDFQVLLRETTSFGGQVVVFCQHLNWPLLATAMEDYSRRLSCSQRPELKDLIQVGIEVTAVRAKLFHDRGWKNAEDLTKAGAEQISACILDCLPYQHDEQQSSQQLHVNRRIRLQQNTREMADKIVQRAIKIVNAHRQEQLEKQQVVQEEQEHVVVIDEVILQAAAVEESKNCDEVVERMVANHCIQEEVEPNDDELAAWAELNVK